MHADTLTTQYMLLFLRALLHMLVCSVLLFLKIRMKFLLVYDCFRVAYIITKTKTTTAATQAIPICGHPDDPFLFAMSTLDSLQKSTNTK